MGSGGAQQRAEWRAEVGVRAEARRHAQGANGAEGLLLLNVAHG
jgi:hypothetical protein